MKTVYEDVDVVLWGDKAMKLLYPQKGDLGEKNYRINESRKMMYRDTRAVLLGHKAIKHLHLWKRDFGEKITGISDLEERYMEIPS